MADRIELTLAHSPDSDDLVMWWPLTGMHGPDGTSVAGDDGVPAVASVRFAFRTLPEDVQVLNRRAIERSDLDITAISAHAYPHLCNRYRITACGASMGEGYGPKLVCKADSPLASLAEAMAADPVVAVPGVHTTAALTLSILADDLTPGHRPRMQEMLFSEIPGAVAQGEFAVGLLIHEAQLTFEQMGLRVLVDLGAAWGERTGGPLPLGLNVVRRDLDERFGTGSLAEVARLLDASVAHAAANREASKRFLRLHAEGREEWLDDALVDRYLDMYVSAMSVDMGSAGREALAKLFGEATRLGLAPDAGELDVIGGALGES